MSNPGNPTPSWQDLSDDELAARLRQRAGDGHGVHLDDVRHLVADRDEAWAGEFITEALDDGAAT